MSESGATLKRTHGPRRVLVGRVISDKMNETIVVKVERRMPHPQYRKIVTRSAKYMAHNPEGVAKAGDKVEIIETRPLSRRKRFKLSRVLVGTKGESS